MQDSIRLFGIKQRTAPARAGAELSVATRTLALALLAALPALSALSRLLLAALSGLLALLARLLLAAPALLATAALLATLILLALSALLATALTTLIGIVHDRSCVRLAPTVLNGPRWGMFRVACLPRAP
jgi:hypothetical protein